MTAEIAKVIAHIARDLVALAQAVLEDDRFSVNKKINRNTLKDSNLLKTLEYKVDTSGNPVITALFNNYVVFLEWTRPPKHKKKPPIDVLRDWAAKNGISTDASTLWAISNAIWRDGHEGRPIFATIDAEADGLFMDDWSDKIFNKIVEQLNNFFL